MTLREFYDITGGGYEETLARMVNETLMRRFLGLFFEDPSFSRLIRAVEAEDDTDAFEAVHTIKGNALNVGLKNLGHSASDLTEALRHGRTANLEQAYETLCSDYRAARNGFEQLD